MTQIILKLLVKFFVSFGNQLWLTKCTCAQVLPELIQKSAESLMPSE